MTGGAIHGGKLRWPSTISILTNKNIDGFIRFIYKFIMWIICDNMMIYSEMIIMSQQHVRTCDDNEDIMGISWYINILYISSNNTPTITGSDSHPRSGLHPGFFPGTIPQPSTEPGPSSASSASR
jgi:hypothetical protein